MPEVARSRSDLEGAAGHSGQQLLPAAQSLLRPPPGRGALVAQRGHERAGHLGLGIPGPGPQLLLVVVAAHGQRGGCCPRALRVQARCSAAELHADR